MTQKARGGDRGERRAILGILKMGEAWGGFALQPQRRNGSRGGEGREDYGMPRELESSFPDVPDVPFHLGQPQSTILSRNLGRFCQVFHRPLRLFEGSLLSCGVSWKR